MKANPGPQTHSRFIPIDEAIRRRLDPRRPFAWYLPGPVLVEDLTLAARYAELSRERRWDRELRLRTYREQAAALAYQSLRRMELQRTRQALGVTG